MTLKFRFGAPPWKIEMADFPASPKKVRPLLSPIPGAETTSASKLRIAFWGEVRNPHFKFNYF